MKKQYTDIMMISFLSILLTGSLMASAEGSSSAGSSSEGAGPTSKREQLGKLKEMGGAKDLSVHLSLFEGDCPSLLEHDDIVALTNAEVEKIPYGHSGQTRDYFKKKTLTLSGRAFSANIKANLSLSNISQAVKENKHILATLAKKEEFRDQDTNKVKAGASFCSYHVFTARADLSKTIIEKLKSGLKESVYGDFNILAKNAHDFGATPIEPSIGDKFLRIAISQPEK
jgi:hypothetical protein